MTVISGSDQLAAFRGTWTGERILELVQVHDGRLRIDWALGVGKSHNIDFVIEAAIQNETYDLVIALFPTRRIIEERKWIAAPPKGLSITNLTPRPNDLCGPNLNPSWEIFEKNSLGALGRVELCSHCFHHSDCAWPKQFGKSLKGTQVIFGTQAHLERSPSFIEQLVYWSKAQKVLVILDEVNFIMKPLHRKIHKNHLELFVETLTKLNSEYWGEFHARWLYIAELLVHASTYDLRSSEWHMPFIPNDWSLSVQSRGYQMHGDAFVFLPFELKHFSRSSLESRERDQRGDIHFATAPKIKDDFLIYSGTAHHDFSQYRVGDQFASPFNDYSFENPETRWYNIGSRLGAKKYFYKNSVQILDFFSKLAYKRLKAGHRPLFIAKKCFLSFCARNLEKLLRDQGLKIKILVNGWHKELLDDPEVLPIIHYGMIGTNLFEHFDSAYCLTGYYVTECAVNGILQDILASDMKIPLNISTEGRPCRRKAGVLNSKDRSYDIHGLAQHALDYQEIETVLQAVGRVRPYTSPCEIITFQCGEHPKQKYTEEFTSLGEAREYFGILSSRSEKKEETREKTQKAKQSGLTQKNAAAQLGFSLRTIKRHWATK